MADYTIAGDDRRWKRFEKLVARMLETLSPDASVTYDDSIRGSLSQAARQIDVSIRRSTTDGEQLAIVQCRDYKSLLDVNAIGEFDSVIRDVGASKGIMVSVHGFTETAKTYAGALNIDLLRLVDAEQKIWSEYFGDAPPSFRQVVKVPTVVTHRMLEITFSFHTTRAGAEFRMPYDFHDGLLRHADGRSAGTPLNLIGTLWASETFPQQPGAGFVIVDLAEPVRFDIDPSRTPICRIMFFAAVIETHRFGLWELAKIEGLANDLDGSIQTRGFTTTAFNIEDVLENWTEITSPDDSPSRPTLRLTTAGGWDVDDTIEPPHVSRVRSVDEREFQATDAICP